jgi:hypothetical protein
VVARSTHHNTQLRLATLILIPVTLAGCGTGEVNVPASQHPVEWVTDPESDSTEFLSVKINADGAFQVGNDVPPGAYQSFGSRLNSICVWRRLSVTPNGDATVLESGAGSGPFVISIKSSDSVFETASCLPWTRRP